MSEGRVWHKDCGGEFIYEFGKSYVCDKCGTAWDGRQRGIVTHVGGGK